MTTNNDPMASPETPNEQQVTPSIAIPEFEFPPAVSRAEVVGVDPWAGFKKLVACNPLYLLSAALLLYGFYLVSADVTFFKADISRVFFNLGSLQLYEVLLVLTAVWLARRAVWYDSTLLTGLENLLLLAPFILLSEAALIDKTTVLWLGIGAALVAAARIGLLKTRIRELNFPKRSVVAGLLVLVVNTSLLIVYRVLHEFKFGTQPDFGAAFQMHRYTWWIILPLVVALGNFVPFCSNMAGTEWPKRRWLPLGYYALWLAGTCVHCYSLGYVYDFKLSPDLVAPSVWAFAWLLWLKVSRIVPGLKADHLAALWMLPALSTLLALGQRSKVVYLVLTAINIGAYLVLYASRRNRAALHLVLISCVALVAGFPEEWGRRFFEDFNRGGFVMAAGAVYVLLCATMSRDAKAGLLGSIMAACISLALLRNHEEVGHLGFQIGVVYLLLHSLRWFAAQDGAGLVRWLAASGWVLHSLFWVTDGGGGWSLIFMASLPLSATLLVRWIWRLPLNMALASSAIVVLLLHPTSWAITQLKTAPAGALAVIASFALFGLGTLVAWAKSRGHKVAGQ